nr:hypothetical protein BgiMline_020625 [Biomphalaria glabrata]
MSKVVDKECLERNYTFVTNEIDALELVDRLVESEAISSSDRTRIVDIKSNIVRNSDLVNIILNSSSEYVLNSFLKSLEPKYKHVLDKLQEQDLTKAIKSSGMGINVSIGPIRLIESPGILLRATLEEPCMSPSRLRDFGSEEGLYCTDSSEDLHSRPLMQRYTLTSGHSAQARDEIRILKEERDTAMNEIRMLKAERDTSAEYTQFTARANNHQQKFLPFIDFSLNHLPACYQQDEMINLIKSLADLTVKIEVKDVHEIREQFWKDKIHFFEEDIKSKRIILGSGKVEDVTLYSEKDAGPCPCRCKKCKSVPKQKWGEIRILTSAQLLYDNKDAKRFVCTLFYDDETSHTITVIGENIVVKNIERDICILTCVTCDLDLIACLESMLDKFEECWENAFDKYIHLVKWEDEKLIVLVSHPLGYKKHISIGKKLDCQRDAESKGINYDVPTLPGSRGAFLLVPDFDVINKNVKIL